MEGDKSHQRRLSDYIAEKMKHQVTESAPEHNRDIHIDYCVPDRFINKDNGKAK
ncbi:hypothetical protein [Morganella morganii]|uniref:hypothetical protein n=1 Tax=Morganella morganii TaxID=582 RepID=UPI001646B62F|nr:hypothetical protein [Morganella morganii]MBC3968020.1 hypothetical protein [Morganella morganii]